MWSRIWRVQGGRTSRTRRRILWLVGSGQLRGIELLQKNSSKRPQLKQLLVHPWIVQATPELWKLRREAKREQEFRVFSLANPGTMKIYDEFKTKTQELTHP